MPSQLDCWLGSCLYFLSQRSEYTGKQLASDILNDYEAPHQIPWKREALLQLYQHNHVTDLRINIKRSKTFFLERQLAWLGKTYDKHCWVTAPDIEECATSLMDHLISWSKEGYFLPTKEFIKTCYDFLPKDLEALKNDIHKKNYLPKLTKLNKCFQELGLPYRIGAKQLMHDGKRKTHWKIEKISQTE